MTRRYTVIVGLYLVYICGGYICVYVVVIYVYIWSYMVDLDEISDFEYIGEYIYYYFCRIRQLSTKYLISKGEFFGLDDQIGLRDRIHYRTSYTSYENRGPELSDIISDVHCRPVYDRHCAKSTKNLGPTKFLTIQHTSRKLKFVVSPLVFGAYYSLCVIGAYEGDSPVQIACLYSHRQWRSRVENLCRLRTHALSVVIALITGILLATKNLLSGQARIREFLIYERPRAMKHYTQNHSSR